jgi:hypothetical protein
MKQLRIAGTVIGIVGVVVVLAHAADMNKALGDAEGRRRAAENGLKAIKAKPSGVTDEIRTLYTEAAGKQNAWLDAVCQAIEQGGGTAAPDVSAAAQSAAASLIAWVKVRNGALGQPELAATVAEDARKNIVQNLVDISADVWKTNRTADPKKRASAAAGLKERLKWKSFDEVS